MTGDQPTTAAASVKKMLEEYQARTEATLPDRRQRADDVPFDLDPVVDQQDGQEARRVHRHTLEFAGLLDAIEAVQSLDIRREADLVVPLLTLRDADGAETVLVEGVVSVSVRPDALLAQLAHVEDAAAPVAWTAQPHITEAGRDAIAKLVKLAEEW